MLNKIIRIVKRPSILFLKIFTYFEAGRAFNARYFLKRNYLKNQGWIDSAKKKMPVDKDGKALPWFTYSFLNFLEPRLNNSLSVFEYGSGNSTLWFSKRVKDIVSLEHHAEWYSILSDKLNAVPNIKFILKALDNGDYEKEITNYKTAFDIIIIDGRERINCAINSVEALTNRGVIIWDDAQRDEYNEGYDYLTNNGFKRLDFKGLRPMGDSITSTAVFYKENNCLGI